MSFRFNFSTNNEDNICRILNTDYGNQTDRAMNNLLRQYSREDIDRARERVMMGFEAMTIDVETAKVLDKNLHALEESILQTRKQGYNY